MKIIGFGASSSLQSINKKLASYVAHSIEGAEIEILDLNDYEMSIYSIDRELSAGVPNLASEFLIKLESVDLIIISFAEHNGSYTASFKNIFDWVSRIKLKMFENKKLLLLSTSAGPRGGETVLNMALERFPRHGAHIIGSISLPSFKDNFDDTKGIISEPHKQALKSILSSIKKGDQN